MAALSSEPLTPLCPLCSTPPVIVLDSGRQSFCGNDACPALVWDQHIGLDELLTNARPAVDSEPVVIIDGHPITESELDAAIWQVVDERGKRVE